MMLAYVQNVRNNLEYQLLLPFISMKLLLLLDILYDYGLFIHLLTSFINYDTCLEIEITKHKFHFCVAAVRKQHNIRVFNIAAAFTFR